MNYPLWEPHEGRAKPAEEIAPRPDDLWRAGGSPETQSNHHGARRQIASRPESRPGRMWRRYVATTAVFLAIFLLADAAYVVVGISEPLYAARGSLQQAQKTLGNGDLARAEDLFRSSLHSARRAQTLAERPAAVLGSFIPYLGANARAVQGLSHSARLVSEAGMGTVSTARLIGITSAEERPPIYSNGRVDLEVVEKARPIAGEVAGRLDRALTILGGLATPNMELLRGAVQTGRQELAEATRTAETIETLLGSLPALLGRDGRRRYLLAFQAPGEARATGGVVGFYGVLIADAGRIKLERIGPYKELLPDPIDPVDAPPDFSSAYGPHPLSEWPQANVSPNFPAVAEVLVRMYEAATGERLDGVIAMDPVAFDQLLAGAHPIAAPQLGTSLTSENAAGSIMVDSYLQLSSGAQDKFLRKVIADYWRQVRKGDIDFRTTAEALARSVATRHLMVYSRNSATQQDMAALGASGSLDEFGSNMQLIFHNNYAANKVDYFLDRSIKTEIKLSPNGDALIDTTVRLENQAAKGPPSLLLGLPARASRLGINHMTLHFLAPRGARFTSYGTEGATSPVLEYEDGGFPVAWDVVELPAGAATEVTISYTVPGAAEIGEATGTFRFTMLPQPVATPDRYELKVVPPAGMFVTNGAPPRATWIAEGILEEPLTVDLTLSRR